MNIVHRARNFAREAHHTQKRKYTGEPYWNHLQEVALLCAQYGLSKKAIAAAYLHDVIEDQPVTYDQVREEFGREIADMVLALTDVPFRVGGPARKERKLIDLARLEKANGETQSIKCADSISNTKDIVRNDKDFARTYLPEKRATLTILTKADPELLALAWKKLVEAERVMRDAA